MSSRSYDHRLMMIIIIIYFFVLDLSVKHGICNKLAFLLRYPNVKLYQAYGMTEGSPLASEKPEPGKNKKGSLGKPVCNTTIKVLYT